MILKAVTIALFSSIGSSVAGQPLLIGTNDYERYFIKNQLNDSMDFFRFDIIELSVHPRAIQSEHDNFHKKDDNQISNIEFRIRNERDSTYTVWFDLSVDSVMSLDSLDQDLEVVQVLSGQSFQGRFSVSEGTITLHHHRNRYTYNLSSERPTIYMRKAN